MTSNKEGTLITVKEDAFGLASISEDSCSKKTWNQHSFEG